MKIKLKKYQDTAESVKPDSRYEKLESDPPLTCVLQTKLVLKKHKYKKNKKGRDVLVNTNASPVDQMLEEIQRQGTWMNGLQVSPWHLQDHHRPSSYGADQFGT